MGWGQGELMPWAGEVALGRGRGGRVPGGLLWPNWTSEVCRRRGRPCRLFCLRSCLREDVSVKRWVCDGSLVAAAVVGDDEPFPPGMLTRSH